mgnify:CR=1 FL=1
MTNKEIIMKLIGPIKPVGETTQDNSRYDNLVELCDLVDGLVGLIDNINYKYEDSQEFSVKRASDYAKHFLTNTLGIKE